MTEEHLHQLASALEGMHAPAEPAFASLALAPPADDEGGAGRGASSALLYSLGMERQDIASLGFEREERRLQGAAEADSPAFRTSMRNNKMTAAW